MDENVATTRLSASVIRGEMKTALLDGDTHNYDLDRGFTRHPIDDNNGTGIVIKLGQPYIINSIKLLLWDKDMRFENTSYLLLNSFSSHNSAVLKFLTTSLRCAHRVYVLKPRGCHALSTYTISATQAYFCFGAIETNSSYYATSVVSMESLSFLKLKTYDTDKFPQGICCIRAHTHLINICRSRSGLDLDLEMSIHCISRSIF